MKVSRCTGTDILPQLMQYIQRILRVDGYPVVVSSVG